MKKKLEAELISIAHRILKLKNKSELIQLHQETQKLYEKLSVLRFVEENFADAKPTIGQAEIEEKLETVFENNSNNPIEELQTTVIEEKTETVPDSVDTEKITASLPEKEAIIFEVPETKKTAKQVSLEDLLGGMTSDPVFDRVDKVETETEVIQEKIEEKTAEIPEEKPKEEIVFEEVETPLAIEPEIVLEKEIATLEDKPIVSKDASNKTITLGLNDRIAFEKQLFGGSAADLNRVISQLITYDTFEEAQDFIEDMVKPDYNNWEGKEDYAQRFMDIVEKKFS